MGIVSYGAYVPRWRISKELLSRGAKGERAVAGPDEDSLTMAVDAAIDCLRGVDRSAVDAVFFASTTSPFKEKGVASMISAALDLRRDIVTADFGGTLRAGTTAMKVAIDAVRAGSLRSVLVVSADCRLGPPGSAFELNFGDGAAAFLIGPQGSVAEYVGGYFVADEIYDVWRRDVDLYVQSWEERFVYLQGYLRVLSEVIKGLFAKEGVGPKEVSKAAIYAPDARRLAELARAVGLDAATQVQDPLLDAVGCTGAAHAPMLLVAALEGAREGDRVLVASYGNGGDALLFTVKEGVEKVRASRRGLRGRLAAKRAVPDYVTYLRWRRLIQLPEPRVPMAVSYPSASAMWRERARIFPLHGFKCKACGTVQFPVLGPSHRVCAKCKSKDSFEEVRLSERRGKLFSFSYDFLRGVPIGLVNLEGGGRLFLEITDADVRELKVDMDVELVFRRLELWRSDGIYGYFWKAAPALD
ncbi:MAG: OB-fold domain-containing protein [Candidatus Nezhaarchaeales archaeon]